MKQLRPYKKFIIAAAVIQSVIVVIAGFILFKSMANRTSVKHSAQEKQAIEAPLQKSN